MQHLTALTVYFVVLMSLAGVVAATAVSVLVVTTQRARRVALAARPVVSRAPSSSHALHLGHQH